MAKMDMMFSMALIALLGCAVSPPSGSDKPLLSMVQRAIPETVELRDVPVPEASRNAKHAREIVVKEIRGASGALGYCVESTVTAKSGPFRIRVLADTTLSVQHASVVSYTWERGRDVRKSQFTRQFEGKGPDAPLRIGQDIDAMTGATLSSRAMCAGVRDSVTLLKTL